MPAVYTSPEWDTAAGYFGNVASGTLGRGPKGFVVLECKPDPKKCIGKIAGHRNKKGELINEQWLYHPAGLTIMKFHFICVGPPADKRILAQIEKDADPLRSTLGGKERRKKATRLRSAKQRFTQITISVPKARTQRTTKLSLIHI